ncbi:MAG: hypothetical protein AAF296_05935 [Pseudomonadota bacterium]
MKFARFMSVAGVAAATMLCFSPTYAQSLTGNVGSAGVTNGERGVEARIGFDDDGNLGSRVHYDQSFTGWYQLRLIGSFSQPDGGNFDFRSFTIENWLQWSEEASDNSGFNGGLRFAYGIASDSDDTDEAEVRFTLTDKFGDGWEWRTNVIAEMEAGKGSQGGVDLETRFQISRAVDVTALQTDSWRLGVELFSEYGSSRDFDGLDDQAHQIGPVLKASWDNGVYIQTAVRAGLTDGSDDAMMKFFIGREF